MPRISRRSALKLVTAASLLGVVSTSGQHLVRTGKSRLKIGLAAYSFRDYFRDSTHSRDDKRATAEQIDMFQFVDYCSELQVDGAEVTSYYFPSDAQSEYFLKLKRHAFLRGVELSGTAVGNTFTHPKGAKRDKEISHVKTWIDHAALMGIPHIRVFAGNAEGQPLDQAKRNCIEALGECAEAAAAKGVFLGIENHGGIVAEADVLLEIVKTVKSPWVGINLDTGNFHTDDPYRDLERCAPFAVNVQLKSEITARGKQKEQADLGRIFAILKRAQYQGYVVLEYEAAERPHAAVPQLLEQMRELI